MMWVRAPVSTITACDAIPTASPTAKHSIFRTERLNALAHAGLGRYVSLGGAFGLAHDYEYRTTHDLDAWWTSEATHEARARVVASIEGVLAPFGQTRTRAWGDVVSVELRRGGRTPFSFRIAARSALLRDEVPGVWQGDIRVDSFDDLLASKMAALVNRGAPRDFLDIYTLCNAGQTSISACWQLWQERQHLSGADDDLGRAILAVRANLARIEATRPLAEQPSGAADERSAARRAWFDKEFLHGLD